MIAYINKYWYIIVILVLLSGNLFFLFGGNEDYILEYEAKISLLEEQIQEIQGKNVGLKSEIEELESKAESLNKEIEVVEQKRIDIIKSYEYYLKDILELDDTELERWFSTRYPADSTSTTSSTISSN